MNLIELSLPLTMLMAFISGLGIHGITFILMKDSAHNLPGGAIASGMIMGPWYISVPLALLGHVVGVVWVKKRHKIKSKSPEE